MSKNKYPREQFLRQSAQTSICVFTTEFFSFVTGVTTIKLTSFSDKTYSLRYWFCQIIAFEEYQWGVDEFFG